MVTFRVHRILQHESKQLLLVEGAELELCVYDEHTGQTLMRMHSPTLESLERACAILRDNKQ